MSYITLLVYPILALVLFFGAKFSRKGEFNDEWSSIQETKAIQGFVAICIVCHHTAQQTCVEWLESGNIVHGLDVFSNTGFMLVSVFFFWSGYGLYKSVVNKKRYLNRFFSKRVFPVWFPYLIVCFLFTLERIFILKERMPMWFKITNFTGVTIGYSFGWYVQAIIVFYVLFFLAFKYSRYNSDAITWIWIGVVSWIVLGLIIDHNDYFLCGQWWYNSAILFPIGVTFANNEERIVAGLKKYYKALLPASIIAVYITFIISRFMEIHRGYYGQYSGLLPIIKIVSRFETLLSQIVAALVFVIMIILICFKVRFSNKVLTFLGNHTLEIYLTHGFFLEIFAVLYNYRKESFFYGKPWMLLLVTIALTIPAAFLLKKLTALATKIIK